MVCIQRATKRLCLNKVIPKLNCQRPSAKENTVNCGVAPREESNKMAIPVGNRLCAFEAACP